MTEIISVPLRSNTVSAHEVLLEAGFRRVSQPWEDDIYEKDGQRFTFAHPVWQWDAEFRRVKPFGVNIRPIQ